MKLKPPDSSLADYVGPASRILSGAQCDGATPRERLECFKKWVDANSPYSAAEKLQISGALYSRRMTNETVLRTLRPADDLP